MSLHFLSAWYALPLWISITYWVRFMVYWLLRNILSLFLDLFTSLGIVGILQNRAKMYGIRERFHDVVRG